MRIVRWAGAVAVSVLAVAAPVSAQQATPQPVAVFGVGGIVLQQVVHGSPDRDPANNIGPTIGFQFRTKRTGAAGFVFELMAQPVPAKDRHSLFENSFAPFYVIGGVEIGRSKYIRLSAGFTTVDRMAPMAGVAVGFESGRGLLTDAEFIVRAGGPPSAFGVLAGIQLRIGGFSR